MSLTLCFCSNDHFNTFSVLDNCAAISEVTSSSPCEGGMQCFPADGHYSCQCPQGYTYNPLTRSCSSEFEIVFRDQIYFLGRSKDKNDNQSI